MHANPLFQTILRLSNLYRRVLAVGLACLGPDAAYRLTGTLARVLYGALDPIRARSEQQCRAALEGRVPGAEIPRIARQAFVHRIWNLADLMLAERFLHRGTYLRYGGQIPQPFLDILLAAQRNRQPVILLTAYYGPFDLLPVFLGYNGVRAGVLYRPHPNRSFDAWRLRVRRRGGCELIPVGLAAGRIAAILESGGTVALVADHHAERRGLSTTFLGLPTTATRSVGLLARHYGARVAVAGIRRTSRPFHFEILVSEVLHPCHWEAAEDPLACITNHYLRATERMILGDPTQYLWAHPRWGEAFARGLLAGDRSTPTGG